MVADVTARQAAEEGAAAEEDGVDGLGPLSVCSGVGDGEKGSVP